MKMNEAVGKFLKQYRAEHGLTMDDVATASQRYGSGWSSGTISQMERGGSKADSLPVLILLTQALNDLTHEGMTLSGLFRHIADLGESIDLTTTMSIAPQEIRPMLEGERFNLIAIPPFGTEEYRKFMDDMMQADVSDLRPAMPPLAGAEEERRRLMHVTTSAERRAAEKLGVSPDVFGAWCIHLYGQSLDDEAAMRAGGKSSPQKRGRITRVIVREVGKNIDEYSSWLAEAAINGDM